MTRPPVVYRTTPEKPGVYHFTAPASDVRTACRGELVWLGGEAPAGKVPAAQRCEEPACREQYEALEGGASS